MQMGDIEDAGTEVEALHAAACDDCQETYIDPKTGLTVFTAFFHSKRGKCCGCGCRHCPWRTTSAPEHQPSKPTKVKPQVLLPLFLGSIDLAPLGNIGEEPCLHENGRRWYALRDLDLVVISVRCGQARAHCSTGSAAIRLTGSLRHSAQWMSSAGDSPQGPCGPAQ